MKTSILLVEDHVGFRRSLRSLLSHESRLVVVGEATNGAEAVAAARALRPDIILMDLMLPGMSGLDAIRRIRALDPTAQVVVLTMHSDRRLCAEAVAAGASAFISKATPPTELLRTIHGLAGRRVGRDQQERRAESDED